MFEYVNDCPCGKITRGKEKGVKKRQADCVIRAFQKAWGYSGEEGWRLAATKLFTRSLEVGDVQIGEDTWHSFVKQSKRLPRYKVDKNGRQIMYKDPSSALGKKRKYYTVKEYAEATKDDDQGYILLSAHHLTFVKGGKYYDSWDSGKRPVRSAWVLKPEKS